MNTSKNLGIGIGTLMVVVIIGLFLFFKKIYDEPATVDIADLTPTYRLDASKIVELVGKEDEVFIEPESLVEIKGVIKEINYLNNRVTILLEGSDENASHVICDMQTMQSEDLARLAVRDTIVLKGMYKGFLKDAIFLHCVLSEDPIR